MAEIIKINPEHPKKDIIKRAAKIIQAGGTVIFPTETVYGLGANAFNSESVKKIFKQKNRPMNQPLAILISDISEAEALAENISSKTLEIMKKHWPGPLTVVLKKKKNVSGIITGERNSVGLRMPDHPVILELIKESGVPIVATSANKHGNPPPKNAKEAEKELSDVDLILDGGECQIGIPSTVIDATVDPPKVLRQGSLKVMD